MERKNIIKLLTNASAELCLLAGNDTQHFISDLHRLFSVIYFRMKGLFPIQLLGR